MANTPTPDDVMLNREDPETLDASTARQWSLVGHLLHLPPLSTIATANQRNVATRIARFMANMRTDVVDRAGLRNELQESFEQRLGAIQGIDPDANPVRAALASANIPIAEAWLQTIYEHFGERELRAMMSALPASIIPTADHGRWDNLTVMIGGANRHIRIDLTHPIWRTGDQQSIARRLENRTPAQVGINAGAYNGVLTAGDITNIFNSEAEVVDPMLPIGELVLENIPAAGQRTMINLAPIIRSMPNIANMDSAAMEGEFLGNANLARVVERNVHIITIRTGQDVPFTNTNPQTRRIVRGFFRALSRNQSMPFGARNVSLATAIQTRQPIDRLLSGTATNREVLLALSMMQRDPSAAAVLENAQNASVGIRERMTSNDESLRLAQAVRDLAAMHLPAYTDVQTHDGLNAMAQVIHNATGASGTLHGVPVVIVDPGVMTPGEYAEARRSRITQTITRVIVPANPGPPPVAERNNWDQFQRVIENANAAAARYEEAEHQIDAIAASLQQVIDVLRSRGITEAMINGGRYPALANLIINAAGVFDPRRDRINNTINLNEVSRQYASALREANPANRLALRDVAFYEQENTRLTTELAAAEARTNEVGSVGSEACRDIVRRGLENEGLRGQELEDTVTYMFNSIQRNHESVEDLRMYADREFPDGEDDESAAEHWEQGKSFRRLSTLGFSRSQPYHSYLQNLSAANNLGFNLIPPAANAPRINHNFQLRSLPSLLDAHFRLKALTELPEGDPHHVPKTEHIVEFQRELYMAILDRAQKSLQRANGATSPEILELRRRGLETGMEKFDDLSIGDRMELVRSYLNDTARYTADSANKSNLDRMIRRAYHPIEEEMENHNRWKSYLNPFGAPNRSPVTWPKAVLWNVPKWALNTPVAGVWKKGWRSALVGGAVGFVALPGYGLPIGLAATPYANWILQQLMGGKSGGANTSGGN